MKLVCSICVAVVVLLPVFPDVVELKNGARIQGIILAENPDSIEIEVGKNDAGTIRRVLIIDASEISTWAADEKARVVQNDRPDVTRLSGTEYVRRLLVEAEKKIDEQKYDEGIVEFEQAAEIATARFDQLEGKEKVEALGIRAHALRLAQAALEGKLNMIEQRTEGVQDELDNWEKRWTKDWEDLEDRKREVDEGTRKVELGSRQSRSGLASQEKELKEEKVRLDRALSNIGPRLREFEALKVQTEAKIELVKERVDQAEEDAKNAEREFRRNK